MENTIRVMNKIMSVAVTVCIGIWAFFTQGKLAGAAIAAVMIALGLAINRENKTMDERQLQMHVVSSYGALVVTICFILIMQIVEFLKTSHITPGYAYILGVLTLSQGVFQILFRRLK